MTREIKPEMPATGVLKTGSFGDAMFYHIHCQCGSEDCAHDIEIEADDCDVQVHIYHVQHTKWWEKKRWQQIWQIITKGYAEMQTTLVLDEQTALNYSAALKNAMQDVKSFKRDSVEKRKKMLKYAIKVPLDGAYIYVTHMDKMTGDIEPILYDTETEAIHMSAMWGSQAKVVRYGDEN